MDLLLAAEIVEQVGLRHAGRLGDLVDGRAAEAVRGEDVERRFEDHLLLLLLDAGAARGGASMVMRRHCGIGRALIWTNLWTSFCRPVERASEAHFR